MEYTKLQTISRGSFGTVHMARNSKGRPAVMKEVIVAHFSEDRLEAARKEVVLLSSLKHPHIIRYYTHWETKEVLTIVMEFAERGDLEKIISQRTTLYEENEALLIFIQVLLAVEYLHRNSIIHRDITARNILVGEDGVIKLCDLGVSKRTQSVHSGSLAGDPASFPPELLQGGKCSEASDMWACGCFLHHLLSLKPLFVCGSLADLLVTVLTGPLPRIPDLYSEPLETLIFSLLSSEPSRRPAAKVLLSHPLLARHVHTLHYTLTFQPQPKQ